MSDFKEIEEVLRQSKELNQSILMSLSEHIAVLDQEGNILTVNAAWTQFARENDVNFPESVGPGVNYLSICQEALENGDETVTEVIDGIRSVLNGSCDCFEIKYPCDSPTVKRRFLMRVIPLKGIKSGAIITHLDITKSITVEEELIKSEKRFRSIMEHSPLALVVFTPEGQITRVNSSWMQLWGLNEKETAQVLEKYNFLTDKEAEAHGMMPLIKKGFSGESVILPAMEYVSKKTVKDIGLDQMNPNTAWIQCHITPVKNENNEIEYILATNVELTELKRVEEQLRKSEHEKSLILNSTSEIIAFHDLDHNIQWVNKAYLKATGLSLSEVVGRKCYHVWGLNKVCTNCPVLKAIETGESCEAELTPQNQVHWPSDQGCWMVRANPVKSDDGSVIGAIEIAYDITDRVRSEMQVREMASFAELNPDPVLRVNPDGIIVSSNPASVEILGKNALKGTSIYSILPSLSKTDIKKCINDNTILSLEVDIEGRFYLFVLRGIQDLNLLYLYGSDITQLTKIKGEADRLREEHLHIARVVAIGELAASITHELKQPLAAIRSNAQAAHRFLTGKNPDLDELHAILTDIIKDNRRADDVIDRLRTLVRREKFKIIKLNINELIQGLFPLILSYELLRNISLEFKPDDRLSSVSGDRIQLQQVILNLLLNSSEALMEVSEDSRKITILTSQKDTHNISVAIKDNGPGINKQNIDRLFEPFYTTKKEGLGMGLAISRSIVEAHSGSLWAENNSDRGVTFYFTLPVFKGSLA
ncbi:MAG: PAS domain-containing protein [Planctomycetota bacterium]|jgi:signal transduction histidine kinase